MIYFYCIYLEKSHHNIKLLYETTVDLLLKSIDTNKLCNTTIFLNLIII